MKKKPTKIFRSRGNSTLKIWQHQQLHVKLGSGLLSSNSKAEDGKKPHKASVIKTQKV